MFSLSRLTDCTDGDDDRNNARIYQEKIHYHRDLEESTESIRVRCRACREIRTAASRAHFLSFGQQPVKMGKEKKTNCRPFLFRCVG